MRIRGNAFWGGSVGGVIRQAGGDRIVVIVGTASLQNSLLAKLIVERTGYTCEVRPPERVNGHAPTAMALALVDARDSMRIRALSASGVFGNIAVINADAGTGCEEFVAYP